MDTGTAARVSGSDTVKAVICGAVMTRPVCSGGHVSDRAVDGSDGPQSIGARGSSEAVSPSTEEVLHATEFRCPSIPIMVIALLVASAVAQSFASSILSLLINIDLKYGPVEVTRYWMYIGYTGWTQPVVGWLADVIVVFGEKRRPLLVLCATGNAIIYFLFCFKPEAMECFPTFLAASIVSQLCTMGIYIPLNGLLVEVGRTDGEAQEDSVARMSAIMSKTMVWRSVGSLAAMVLQTWLTIEVSVRMLLGAAALWFGLLIPLALVTPRRLFLRPSVQDTNFYLHILKVAQTVKVSFNICDYRSDGCRIVFALLFVFLYTAMPDSSSVYYNYLFGAFDFPMWFYSMNNCVGVVGSIVGAYVFSLWMDRRAKQEARGRRRTSMFFIFTVGSVAWALGYVTNMLLCTGFITDTLHIPAKMYIPIDSFIFSMFERFAYMPMIAMAAEYAPKDFEATTFEVFSVVSMAGATLSLLITSCTAERLGISRTDYSNLWILIAISIASKLVPIPVAYCLPIAKMCDSSEGVDAEENDVRVFMIPATAGGNDNDEDARSVCSDAPLLPS